MTQTTQPGSPKAIFTAAREIVDAAERERFLETSCAGDMGLKKRVETLLQASTQTDGFLTETAEVESEVRVAVGDRIGYFGDYVLLDEIARGASGVVFRARQTSLDRVVALKMLRGHGLAEGDDGLRRFKAEAQAAAGLKHPNIVPIYEVGEFEGQGYYSMPLIEGGTLISRAAEFHEPRKATALMVKVARALHAAHEHGLLHRDIKPGNILIDAEGEPQVTDFGIARKMGLDSDLTITGQIMGTPYYMSPEQAIGETQSLTAAADVYGLGAVLYELLTGEKPFSGESMIAVLKKVVEELPKSPQGIERDLSVIVMKCLEKAPAARYASAAALADDLEKWQRGEPITARPAGSIERVVKWTRRSPYKAALFALSAVSLISWAVLGLLLVPPPPVYEPGGAFIKAKPGIMTDVLRLIDIVNPNVLTVWRKEGTAFIGQRSAKRIALSMPVHSTGDYDLSINFTLSEMKNSGRQVLPLMALPVGERSVHIVLGSDSGCRCPQCWTNGTEAPLATLPAAAHPIGPLSGLGTLKSLPLLTNGTALFNHALTADTPHKLEVQVRLLPKARARFTATLDGQPFIQWEGPLTDLPDEQARQQDEGKPKQFFFTVWNPANYTIRYTRMIFTPLTEKAWLRTPFVRPGE